MSSRLTTGSHGHAGSVASVQCQAEIRASLAESRRLVFELHCEMKQTIAIGRASIVESRALLAKTEEMLARHLTDWPHSQRLTDTGSPRSVKTVAEYMENAAQCKRLANAE